MCDVTVKHVLNETIMVDWVLSVKTQTLKAMPYLLDVRWV